MVGLFPYKKIFDLLELKTSKHPWEGRRFLKMHTFQCIKHKEEDFKVLRISEHPLRRYFVLVDVTMGEQSSFTSF